MLPFAYPSHNLEYCKYDRRGERGSASAERDNGMIGKRAARSKDGRKKVEEVER